MNRFIYISLVNILLSMVMAAKLIGCETYNTITPDQPSTEPTLIEECCMAKYTGFNFSYPIGTNNIVAQRSSTLRHTLRRSSLHKSFGHAISKSSKNSESLIYASDLLTTSWTPLAVKSSSVLLIRLRKFRI